MTELKKLLLENIPNNKERGTMKKLSKIMLVTISLGCSVLNTFAVDSAGAAGDLSEIAKISVDAKVALAEAAKAGNADQVAEAGERSDAVDAAMAMALEAYSSMEKAVESGDEDAAQSAVDDIAAAVQKAKDALNGVISQDVKEAVKDWNEANENAGGSARRPYDIPNIYDVPWDSDQVRGFYQQQFANLWVSLGISPSDSEATPE
ncbi:hypothetical protein [Pontiella agarivorans]|uniref:DUF4398 domain-containing protein n=1 Tax=Pontiella agarivorans TaxID=3038953 RepID=A0ABU5N0K9_9BACT|nr:hypothetical protein [Pontiella agarivorans]MDZ8119771.1 hypothetical protein [Pontiella agarivorans]